MLHVQDQKMLTLCLRKSGLKLSVSTLEKLRNMFKLLLKSVWIGYMQLAFSGFVYPSLILTYAGQTAYLIKNPGDMGDAFYKSIPKPVYWPMFVVATLAAIVASQALISATFTIVKQSMALGCFPRVNIRHTSEKQEGQVYSPEMNYTLMVLCIAVVVGFREGTKIGNAFGMHHFFQDH